MNIENMKRILDKIKEYDRIIIFRHKRPDGDAVGSTKGLREILRLVKKYLLFACPEQNGNRGSFVQFTFHREFAVMILYSVLHD